MTIGNKTVVSCHYTLRDENEKGEIIESTEGAEPLEYIQGIDMMLPDFEKNLAGKMAGDKFAFGLKAANAYGEYDETAVAEIPKAAFKLDGVNPDDVFVEGEMLPLEDENGQPMQGIITKVTPDTVSIDFNHPMAGYDLYFTGYVNSVRAATQEELEHGHVHGEGGHH